MRLIREEEAAAAEPPAQQLERPAEDRGRAQDRAGRLSKLVRGELDWIVMKCLEKDRSRRYETANGLARDLERYLADEPVEACPPSCQLSAAQVRPQVQEGAGDGGGVRGPLGRRRGDEHLAGGVGHVGREGGQACRARGEPAATRRGGGEASRPWKPRPRQTNSAMRLVSTAYASGMGLAQRAWEENNVVRARELLAEVPKEAAGRNLRGFEWYYLSRLCHPDELTLEGHAGWVMSVAFSPDGQRLASGSGDQTVKIWDSATGKELFSLKGHAGQVRSVAFSPDGQRLASASEDQTVKIWDSATGKELFALKGHAGWVWSVAFSPDGQRLASGS